MYSSAHCKHVRHGDVLGRAAGCSVCNHDTTTPKDTPLILICRTLTAITVALSLPVHMGFVSSYYVAFLSYKVFTWRALPEVWRLVTPFFITGPSFGLLMDPYFLWTYTSQLEREASRFSQPGDFFTYIAFVCAVILVSRANFRAQLAHTTHASFLYRNTNLSYTARPVYLSCHGPQWGGKLPLHCAGARHSQTYTERSWSVGMEGFRFEKSVRRDMWRDGGCWPLHLLFPSQSFLPCVCPFRNRN